MRCYGFSCYSLVGRVVYPSLVVIIITQSMGRVLSWNILLQAQRKSGNERICGVLYSQLMMTLYRYIRVPIQPRSVVCTLWGILTLKNLVFSIICLSVY